MKTLPRQRKKKFHVMSKIDQKQTFVNKTKQKNKDWFAVCVYTDDDDENNLSSSYIYVNEFRNTTQVHKF